VPHSYSHPCGSAAWVSRLASAPKVPTFRSTAALQAHATSMPETAWSADRLRPCSIPRGASLPWFRSHLSSFDTSSVVYFRSSSWNSSDPVWPDLFLLCTRPWLLATAAEGDLGPASVSRSRGAFPSSVVQLRTASASRLISRSWRTEARASPSRPSPIPQIANVEALLPRLDPDQLKKSPFETGCGWAAILPFLNCDLGRSASGEKSLVRRGFGGTVCNPLRTRDWAVFEACLSCRKALAKGSERATCLTCEVSIQS